MHRQAYEYDYEVDKIMCSGMNHKRMGDIAKESREKEQIILLKKRMAEALEKDQSHVKRLNEN